MGDRQIFLNKSQSKKFNFYKNNSCKKSCVNYFFVTGKFFVKGGIQRGCPLLASGGVAVEQKSNVSAISCPTSNIACSKPRTHLKRRKLVRKKLQEVYSEFTQRLHLVYSSDRQVCQPRKRLTVEIFQYFCLCHIIIKVIIIYRVNLRDNTFGLNFSIAAR